MNPLDILMSPGILVLPSWIYPRLKFSSMVRVVLSLALTLGNSSLAHGTGSAEASRLLSRYGRRSKGAKLTTSPRGNGHGSSDSKSQGATLINKLETTWLRKIHAARRVRLAGVSHERAHRFFRFPVSESCVAPSVLLKAPKFATQLPTRSLAVGPVIIHT